MRYLNSQKTHSLLNFRGNSRSHLGILGIMLIALILYYPSLWVFYTNDDFFLLKISQAASVREFINFFNFTTMPSGLGMYRPITIQVFYFLGRILFDMNPLGLHVISMLTFFAVIWGVYKLVLMLTKDNNIALISTLMYATSASHFGQLYYLAVFQELGVTLFVLLSVMLYIKYLNSKKIKYYLISLAMFILALLSKETAIVLPVLLTLIVLFVTESRAILRNIRSVIVPLITYYAALAVYLYLHFFVYGVAQGVSYIWDFTPVKTLNTLVWYLLWSSNLPEMLVDFVGPGLKINSNLFTFWGSEIKIILILFVGLISLLLYAIFKTKDIKRNSKLFLFCMEWFVVSLIPVLFLPWHKFAFYLTLPLVGVVIIISALLNNLKSKTLIIIFLMGYILGSVATLNLTVRTHWITRGAEVSKNVSNYLKANIENLSGKTLVFYDTPEDSSLPWSPTEVVKTALSDNNFFKVYYGDDIKAKYTDVDIDGGIKLRSRQFLGY